MPTRISHIPFYNRMSIPDSSLIIAGVIYALPLVFLLAWKPMLAAVFAAAPLLVLLIAHGPAAIVFLIAATFVFAPLTQGIVLLPADVAAFVVIAAYLTDLLCREPVPKPNYLARPYLIYVCIMLLSIALEGFTALSVKFFMHQILLFVTFMAVAHFGRRANVGYILIVYVLAAVGNSIYALMQFLGAGVGVRAFGLAGRVSGDHAMVGFLVSLVFYIWSRDLRFRILWGLAALITAGGIIVAQTRASAITAGWGLVAVVAFALWQGHRMGRRAPAKNLSAAVLLGILVIPILAAYTPLFEGIVHRFGKLGLQPAETVLLRVTLWKAALAAFWSNPLLGIGTGNFPLIYEWVPDVKFSPVYYIIAGLSTHNVFLGALVETGIVGFCALAFLFMRAIYISYRNLSATTVESELPMTQSLFIIALIIMGSSLYAGAWFSGNNSYHMVIFLGLIASYRNHTEQIFGKEMA